MSERARKPINRSAASEMPAAKQTVEAPTSDEWDLSVEHLREWLLKPFERARQPIIEAKRIMQEDGVSDQLIAQNLSWEKGITERHYAETIKLTTNPRTGKLWDLSTLEAAGMISEGERLNILRAHGEKEPPYYYCSAIVRRYDPNTNRS